MEMYYKIELWGGNPNGAIRYYNKLQTAKSQAKKYINKNNTFQFGGGHAFAEIYFKFKDKWLKLETIE